MAPGPTRHSLTPDSRVPLPAVPDPVRTAGSSAAAAPFCGAVPLPGDPDTGYAAIPVASGVVEDAAVGSGCVAWQPILSVTPAGRAPAATVTPSAVSLARVMSMWKRTERPAVGAADPTRRRARRMALPAVPVDQAPAARPPAAGLLGDGVPPDPVPLDPAACPDAAAEGDCAPFGCAPEVAVPVGTVAVTPPVGAVATPDGGAVAGRDDAAVGLSDGAAVSDDGDAVRGARSVGVAGAVLGPCTAGVADAGPGPCTAGVANAAQPDTAAKLAQASPGPAAAVTAATAARARPAVRPRVRPVVRPAARPIARFTRNPMIPPGDIAWLVVIVCLLCATQGRRPRNLARAGPVRPSRGTGRNRRGRTGAVQRNDACRGCAHGRSR